MTEDRLQSDIFKWFWNTYPNHRRCLFHPANGGWRSQREAAKFKAIGVVAGVPDLVLVHNSTCTGFELKTDTGRLSAEQKKVIEAWGSQGVTIHVVRSLDEFQTHINNIL